MQDQIETTQWRRTGADLSDRSTLKGVARELPQKTKASLRVSMKPLIGGIGLLAVWLLIPTAHAELPTTLDRHFNRAVEMGDITGAQIAAVRNGEVIFTAEYGAIELDSEAAVEVDTLFLIGSCSKPFASLCVLSLIEDPSCELRLDAEIDQWLPAFAEMDLSEGGKASRSPTVEELLNHHGGIFSQKVKITPEQARWLYTFGHTLEKGVDEMARFPLLAQPGTRYAYSGAGYCVLGRVAELAVEKDFETILQESICRAIGLERTTYFPSRHLPEAPLAIGTQNQKAPHQLGPDHRFPLIGGSLYSTATEMARFGDAVSAEWNDGEKGLLRTGQSGIRHLAKTGPESSDYGLGWKVISKNGTPAILTHSGSLQSYRAWMAVDLESGTCLAACWTLGSKRQPVPVAQWLQRSLSNLSSARAPIQDDAR